MFALFPVLLGILIGASLDDSNITKKDFASIVDPIEKEIIEPMSKRLSKVKQGFNKATEVAE